MEQVWKEINEKLNQYISELWEELCRNAIPRIKINGKTFKLAQRWWGNGTDKKPMEIDIVAESVDKSYILFGEVKWANKISATKTINELKTKIKMIPFIKNQEVLPVLFLKHKRQEYPKDVVILTPADIIIILPNNQTTV